MSKFILAVSLFFILSTSFARKSNEINLLLHDQSFVAMFGALPNVFTSEKLRIQTHLSYVENLLRLAPVSHLTALQYRNRRVILDMLHSYWQAGVFPVNAGYPGERKPCFIDDDGNICAVGYLVAETRGWVLAWQINQSHQYDLIMEMNEPVISEWAGAFGLSLEECAMIQPMYGPPITSQTVAADIKTGYGVSSAAIGGGLIGLNIANLRGGSETMSWIGIIGGTVQVIMGTTNIRKPGITGGINEWTPTTVTYKAQNNLSYVNIAMGSAGIVTNAINLAMKRKNKNQKNAYNLYSYPNYANSVSVGFSIRRTI